MNAVWLCRLFNRRTARTLLWTALLLAGAVAANIVGIYFIGSISGWEQWLAEVSGFFLLWRLCLYGATAYGWVWMRRRLVARQSDAHTRRRLLRTEIAAVLALVALECSLLVQST
ncbi:hypothetical protein [Nitrosomonas eutropha]|uniref:Uncharacterized protein n=2 Tax=Nitrosomonas eutropha TaxID=916 RepID=A0ABX5MCS9_9PROT|nr:hypothetical protein [Nitrosomonas eutropha]ABI58362.1 conserved hypothetical protein [Nitrosomonas eutropha C91]PXV84187.1 hypothetical protein C8R14_10168 [Nitrosomonas eutropha]